MSFEFYHDPFADALAEAGYDIYKPRGPAVFVPLPALPQPVVAPVVAVAEPVSAPVANFVAPPVDEDPEEIAPPDFVPELGPEPAWMEEARAAAFAEEEAADREMAPAKDEVPLAEPKRRQEKPSGKRTKALQEPLDLNIGLQATDKMKFLRLVARDRDLSDRAKVAAVPLVDLIHTGVGHAWISMDSFAVEIGASWRTAKRAIDDLREAGYILVRDNAGSTCHVSLNLKRAPRVTELTSPKRRRDPEKAAPETGRGDNSDTPRGDSSDIPRVSVLTPESEIIQRSESERETSQNARLAPPPFRARPFDIEWPDFCDAWPGDVLNDQWKGGFIRARREGYTLSQIIEAARAAYWNLVDGQEPMSLARFFGAEHYKDDDRKPALPPMRGLRPTIDEIACRPSLDEEEDLPF